MCHGCAKDTGYRGTIFMYLPFRRLKVAVWFSDDSCYIWTIARMFQKWQLTINLFHLLDIVTNTSLGIFYVSCYAFISSVYSVDFYISKFKNSSLYFFYKITNFQWLYSMFKDSNMLLFGDAQNSTALLRRFLYVRNNKKDIADKRRFWHERNF